MINRASRRRSAPQFSSHHVAIRNAVCETLEQRRLLAVTPGPIIDLFEAPEGFEIVEHVAVPSDGSTVLGTQMLSVGEDYRLYVTSKVQIDVGVEADGEYKLTDPAVDKDRDTDWGLHVQGVEPRLTPDPDLLGDFGPRTRDNIYWIAAKGLGTFSRFSFEDNDYARNAGALDVYVVREIPIDPILTTSGHLTASTLGLTTVLRDTSVSELSNGSVNTGGSTLASIVTGGTALTASEPPATPIANENGGLIGSATGAGGDYVEAGGFGSGTVRLFDGVVGYNANDLSSSGFGAGYGVTRSWTNHSGYQASGEFGNGWTVAQLPHLQQISGNVEVAVVSSGTSARYFDYDARTSEAESRDLYDSRFFTGLDELEYLSDQDVFVHRDPSGTEVQFYGHGEENLALGVQGKFKKMTDAGGNVTTAVYSVTGSGELQKVTRGSGQNLEEYVYTRLTSGSNVGKVSNVTLQRSANAGTNWSTVRQADYTYYGTSSSNGNEGDLELVEIKDASGNEIDTYYYRYYTKNEAATVNGLSSGLQYALHPQAYDRATDQIGNVRTATDVQIAPYADHYYEYNFGGQVITEVASGEGCNCSGNAGRGEFRYAYNTSSNTAGFNSWKYETTETLPDDHVNHVYTNTYGQPMVRAFEEDGTSNEWTTFQKYDNDGRLLLLANPSAVEQYNDEKPDLLFDQSGNYSYLSDAAGLITTFSYFGTTTATSSVAGGVLGYLNAVGVQHGETATSVPQSEQTYFTRTNAYHNIAPLAEATRFRATDGTGD